MQLFLVHQRLYQVMVAGSEAGVNGRDAERFFDSFDVLQD
jgi:hypothetical protein